MKTFVLLLMNFFLISVLSSTSQAKTYLISDIDDTIKISGDRVDWAKYPDPTIRDKPFAGVDTLFTALAENGVEIRYVSGNQNSERALQFLNVNHFPNPTRLIFRTDTKLKTVDFKVQAISSIILETLKTDPKAQFILAGDNGENDPVTFSQLKEDPKVNQAILKYFVHELYPADIGTPLGNGQEGYKTADELGSSL